MDDVMMELDLQNENLSPIIMDLDSFTLILSFENTFLFQWDIF